MSEIKEGLEILLKYGDDDVSASHDIVYASGTPPEKISEEDQTRLAALLWRWDYSLDCWSRFT